jgi:hypothetical protein
MSASPSAAGAPESWSGIGLKSYGKCGRGPTPIRKSPQFRRIADPQKFLRFPEIEFARGGRSPL